MVVQTADQAVKNANSYGHCDPGMCLQYVRTWLEIPSRDGTAFIAWQNAQHKHKGDRTPPRGAPLFWKSGPGGSGAGHITLCKGDTMRTTDKPTGVVANDDGSWPHDQWGQDYLGWTEDLNGVRIPYLKDAGEDWRASGDVYVKKLQQGVSDSDSVARLRYRLENHGDMPGSHRPGYGKNYGQECLEAVRYWQRNICPPSVAGPTDGTSMSNPQANRLFGDAYNVIEK